MLNIVKDSGKEKTAVFNNVFEKTKVTEYVQNNY